MRIARLAVAAVALSGLAAAQPAPAPAPDRIVNDIFGTAPKGAALEAAIAKAAGSPLGSEANPIRVTAPQGQRAYLARLRCIDGTAPAASRRGSAGIGPYGTILDVYAVSCASGTPASAELYMDMYHQYNETAPAPGFTIAGR